eukprot:Rmarinus@m.1585
MLASASQDESIFVGNVSDPDDRTNILRIRAGCSVVAIEFLPIQNILCRSTSNPPGFPTYHLVVASTDGCVRVFEITRTRGNILSALCVRILSCEAPVKALAVSPDGRTVAFAGDGNGVSTPIRLHCIETGSLTRALTASGESVTMLSFAPDGGRLLSCSSDARVQIWNLSDEPPYPPLSDNVYTRIVSISVCRRGKVLAIGTLCGVRICCARTGSDIRQIDFGLSEGVPVCVNDDGSLVACGRGKDLVLVSTESEGLCPIVREFSGHSLAITCTCFSPDNALVATSSRDGSAIIRDVSGREGLVRVLSGHFRCVTSIAFSPEGSVVVTGSDDKKLRLWSVSRGTCLRVLVPMEACVRRPSAIQRAKAVMVPQKEKPEDYEVSYTKQSVQVRCVVFSPVPEKSPSAAGGLLAAGTADKKIRLWRLRDGQCLHTLNCHSDAPTCLVFTPDGLTLLSAGEDGYLMVWNVLTGECEAVIGPFNFRITSLGTTHCDVGRRTASVLPFVETKTYEDDCGGTENTEKLSSKNVHATRVCTRLARDTRTLQGKQVVVWVGCLDSVMCFALGGFPSCIQLLWVTGRLTELPVEEWFIPDKPDTLWSQPLSYRSNCENSAVSPQAS